MPSDVLTIVVSTGIGVSVIAGVLSGVCYILAHGFTRKRTPESELEWHCYVCGIYLRSRILDEARAVICIQCEERVCRSRCSKREYVTREWICYKCLKKPPWFQGIYNIKSRYKEVKQIENGKINGTNAMKNNNEVIHTKDKDYIRDFIEKLVSTILGEDVDDASVFKTHKDKQYNRLFEKYYQDLCDAITDLSSTLHKSMNDVPFVEQSPGTAHSHLKGILEKLLHDASHLPVINKTLEYSAQTENENTYEELLATAILNKVISKYQDNVPSTSETNNSSKISTSSANYNKGNGYSEKEKLEEKWDPTDFETTSNSSLEEYLQSDSSLGSTKYVDRVSLTIRRQIEKFSPEENVKENVEEVEENIPLFASDSNWFLQKRPFRSTYSPVPVPMLVPNPTSTSKVLIGDQEIDDTSDLSDGGECNNVDSSDGVQNFIIESEMVIEQNLDNEVHSSDEETSADSGVKEDRDDYSEKDKFYDDPKTDITVDDENVEDISLISYDNTERDFEYLEKYGSLPGKIVKQSTPVQQSSNLAMLQKFTFGESISDENLHPQLITEQRTEDATSFFEGRYSKREKEKWKNPVEMTNNPYSKENIEKRIQLNQIFGREYYTKQASLPAGRRKIHEDDEPVWVSRNYFFDDMLSPQEESAMEVDSNYKSENFTTFGDNEIKNDTPFTEKTNDSGFDVVDAYNQEKTEVHEEDGGDEMYIRVNTEGLLHFPSDSENVLLNTEKKEENQYTLIQAKIAKVDDYDSEKPRIVSHQVKNIPNESAKENIPKMTRQKVLNVDEETVPLNKRRNEVIEIFPEKSYSENVEKQPAIITKKCDNTLIRKIYSDPAVRSFALVNREYIPVNLDDKMKSQENDNKPAKLQQKLSSFESISTASIDVDDHDDDNNNNINKQSERSTSTGNLTPNGAFSLEFSDNESHQKSHIYKDYEYNELKEKRLVASRLGDFSKSFPNLLRIASSPDRSKNTLDHKNCSSTENLAKNVSENEITAEQSYVSVKNLKKLFENNVSSYKKEKPVHSLTARSISKQMKENLKNSGNENFYATKKIM